MSLLSDLKLAVSMDENAARLLTLYEDDLKTACERILDDPLVSNLSYKNVKPLYEEAKKGTALFGNHGREGHSLTTPKNVESGPRTGDDADYGATDPSIDAVIKKSDDEEDKILRQHDPEPDIPETMAEQAEEDTALDTALDVVEEEKEPEEPSADIPPDTSIRPKEHPTRDTLKRGSVSREVALMSSLSNKGWSVVKRSSNLVEATKGFAMVTAKSVAELVDKMNQAKVFSKKAQYSAGAILTLSSKKLRPTKVAVIEADALSGYKVMIVEDGHPKKGTTFEVPEKFLKKEEKGSTALGPNPSVLGSKNGKPKNSGMKKSSEDSILTEAEQEIFDDGFTSGEDLHDMMQGERNTQGSGPLGIPDDREGGSSEVDVVERVKRLKEKKATEEEGKKSLSSNIPLIVQSGKGRQKFSVEEIMKNNQQKNVKPAVKEIVVEPENPSTNPDDMLLDIKTKIHQGASKFAVITEVFKEYNKREPSDEEVFEINAKLISPVVSIAEPVILKEPELKPSGSGHAEIVDQQDLDPPPNQIYALMMVDPDKLKVNFTDSTNIGAARAEARKNHVPFAKSKELQRALKDKGFDVLPGKKTRFNVFGDEVIVAQVMNHFSVPPDNYRTLEYRFGVGVKVKISAKGTQDDKKLATIKQLLPGAQVLLNIEEEGASITLPTFNLMRI